MNSRLKNLLLGSVFICVGIGIGIGIGAGIWSDSDISDDPIDDDYPNDLGTFVEFYNEKLGNITGIIDHRSPEHDGVIKFLGKVFGTVRTFRPVRYFLQLQVFGLGCPRIGNFSIFPAVTPLFGWYFWDSFIWSLLFGLFAHYELLVF